MTKITINGTIYRVRFRHCQVPVYNYNLFGDNVPINGIEVDDDECERRCNLLHEDFKKPTS